MIIPCSLLQGDSFLFRMDNTTIKFRKPPKEKIKKRISRNLSDLLAEATGSKPD